MANTARAIDVRRDIAGMFKPPPDRSVSEAIAELLFTGSGKYNPEVTPYMSKPADSLRSRRYRRVVFLGPGRTGKTVTLIDGWIARVIVDDPGDMLVVQSSQDLAGFYSNYRIKRMIAASPEVRACQSSAKHDDNIYTKVFRSGMVLAFAWPSSAQLSGRDFRYVAITEYDAASEDVDDEGSLDALGGKRIETYLSAGKLLCESSVRREYTDAGWRPKTPHEAPPATGITGLYNAGTRCWLYWKCPDCGQWFSLDPDIHNLLNIPSLSDLVQELPQLDAAMWAQENAVLPCPHCGVMISEDHKRALNLSGLWVPDGCWIAGDQVCGEARATDTDSYQMSCMAAGYQTWRAILEKYAVAIQSYARTGSEVDIKSTVNLDQGRAYLPLAALNKRNAGQIHDAAEDLQQGVVPPGVRFIVGTADTQGRGFVTMHWGFGPGANGSTDWWVIDRSKILTSTRTDRSGEALPMEPAAFGEDWKRLDDAVISREFPLGDSSGRSMLVHFSGVDSGGKGGPDGVGGVTEKAYAYWRQLPPQLKQSTRLVKGASSRTAPRVAEVLPDAKGAKNAGPGRGDVPVLMVNTHEIKDGVAGDLDRATRDGGGAHLPRWMDAATFAEFTAEKRTPTGWVNPPNTRNEASDLITYAKAIISHLGCDRPGFWANPPPWAREWDHNPRVFHAGSPRAIAPPKPRPLRRATSNYMGS